MIMEKEYNNGFLGWLFDAYAIECLIGPILYFMMDSSDTLSIVAIVIMIAALIGSIVYHTTWKYKTKWISPGEHFIAVKSIEKEKKQTNPFHAHRFFLYFILVLNLINTARKFDNLYYTYNILIFSGSALISNAKSIGLIIISIAYLLMTSGNVINFIQYNDSSYKIMVIVYGSLLILNLVIGLIYFYRKRTIEKTINE
jgi:hypothetical protein